MAQLSCEMHRHPGPRFGERRGRWPEAIGEGRHMDAAQPTRMDEFKGVEIRGHIQREAMIAHPASDRDAERRDLLAGDPHTGAPGDGFGLETPALEGADERRLEVAEEPVQVTVATGEIA